MQVHIAWGGFHLWEGTFKVAVVSGHQSKLFQQRAPNENVSKKAELIRCWERWKLFFFWLNAFCHILELYLETVIYFL